MSTQPDPQTWDGSTVYDETDLNREFQATDQWLLGHSSNPKPSLRIRGSVNTTLAAPSPDPTWTEVTLDTVDTNRGFATALPATIPFDGDYDLGAQVDVESAVSNKAVRIMRNGTRIGEDDQPGVGSTVPMTATCVIGVKPLSAGDVITIECYNDAGVGVAPASVECLATGEMAPVLWIEWVGVAD